jgi:hypothetical protein
MKKLLPYLLVLTFAALGSRALADDVTVMVIKHGDSMVTLTPNGGDETPVYVPVTFDSGADWSAVRDSYDIAPETLAGLKAKKLTLSIGSDGGATFHKK